MKPMEGQTIEMYGVRVTVFRNGDVYISTKGDVTIVDARTVITDKTISLK
ncbi:MAG: hypothetical protein FHOMOCKG_00006 [Methanophagales virus GBV302]|mgnify:CR=1 FL=1|uniref:Uncharacterized protein n=1 Tax=Methanophagales virus GBV302 TaxID=2999281 RepID=A0A9E9A608_9CAUD|nr:MAG: hypothetical protein QIT37_gp006 [Methanophagales virus GBV302]WAE39534.1 MAG: hypothetical protein FHOMOCKG_00006 [Methanophagales virus GBV302]